MRFKNYSEFRAGKDSTVIDASCTGSMENVLSVTNDGVITYMKVHYRIWSSLLRGLRIQKRGRISVNQKAELDIKALKG